MDRYDIRAYNPLKGDELELMDVTNQVQCTRQSKLKIGAELYVTNGKRKLIDSDYACYYRKIPIRTVKIIKIAYKSKFQKMFRWFVKYPIESITIKFLN